jgi:membrane protein insertase Oxa1/YidC/SpoIIIJ
MTDILTEPIRLAILALAQALGGNVAAAIVVVSLALRAALLPLTLRLARRGIAQRKLLETLKPELEAIAARNTGDPNLALSETMAAYRRVGYKPVDRVSLLGSLAQLPVVGGIYGALKRIPIGDLARPDFPLMVVVVLLSGVASYFGALGVSPTPRAAINAAAIGAMVSFIIFSHMSAAMVLSWGASSLVSAGQGVWLARRRS